MLFRERVVIECRGWTGCGTAAGSAIGAGRGAVSGAEVASVGEGDDGTGDDGAGDAAGGDGAGFGGVGSQPVGSVFIVAAGVCTSGGVYGIKVTGGDRGVTGCSEWSFVAGLVMVG